MDTPRAELKPQTPKIIILEVPKSTIGGIIGPGGKVIQELQAKTETTISIEEVDEKGRVEILGTNQEGIDDAVRVPEDFVSAHLDVVEFGCSAVGAPHAQGVPVVVDLDTGPVGGNHRGDDRTLLP